MIASAKCAPCTHRLPSGEVIPSDRGAEQGEPFGSASTAVDLGEASDNAHSQYSESLPSSASVRLFESGLGNVIGAISANGSSVPLGPLAGAPPGDVTITASLVSAHQLVS